MADHPNAVMARRALDAFNTGDMETISKLLADDIVWHEIGRAEPIRGKAAMQASGGEVDYQITATLHDVVANDEHVVGLVNASATRGGKTLDYRTAEIMHVRDGQITERWAFSDDTAAIVDFFK
jgi:ketosteroid isomerase-like protein